MFFAIIAKHFQKEDKAVEEQRLERAAQQAQQVPGESQSTLEQIKARKRGRGMKPMGLYNRVNYAATKMCVCMSMYIICVYIQYNDVYNL